MAVSGNDGIEERTETRVASPPYIPYLTFKNFIQWLEADGVPLRFDRSAWEKKYSGSTGPQLLTGLRFLGLLKGEAPTPELERLIGARGKERGILLREIFEHSYSAINFEELPRATPGMLRTWIESYGIDGDTVRKAESFFVNAAKDLDIQVSNALRKLARNRPQGTARRTIRRDPKASQVNRQLPEQEVKALPTVVPADRAEAQDSLMLWGLFKRLPVPGSEFPSAERDAWLDAAKTLFNLEYKDGKEG